MTDKTDRLNFSFAGICHRSCACIWTNCSSFWYLTCISSVVMLKFDILFSCILCTDLLLQCYVHEIFDYWILFAFKNWRTIWNYLNYLLERKISWFECWVLFLLKYDMMYFCWILYALLNYFYWTFYCAFGVHEIHTHCIDISTHSNYLPLLPISIFR